MISAGDHVAPARKGTCAPITSASACASQPARAASAATISATTPVGSVRHRRYVTRLRASATPRAHPPVAASSVVMTVAGASARSAKGMASAWTLRVCAPVLATSTTPRVSVGASLAAPSTSTSEVSWLRTTATRVFSTVLTPETPLATAVALPPRPQPLPPRPPLLPTLPQPRGTQNSSLVIFTS